MDCPPPISPTRLLSIHLTALEAALQNAFFTGIRLVEPRWRLNFHGRHAFSVAAPRLWNALSPAIRDAETQLPTFKSRLKTHLIREAYSDAQ